MKGRVRTWFLLAGSCLALALAVALAPTGGALAQSMKSLLVEVVNVPGVSIVNNPPVQAQQSGSWNVGINGGVSIANPAANPVLTRDVDNPGRQPVGHVVQLDLTNANLASNGVSVPAGKLLVVEFVSLRAVMPAGQHPEQVEIRTWAPLLQGGGTIGVNHRLPAPEEEEPGEFVGAHAVKMYSLGNLVMNFKAGRSSSLGAASFTFFITGYLLDCGPGNLCPIP